MRTVDEAKLPLGEMDLSKNCPEAGPRMGGSGVIHELPELGDFRKA